MFNKYLLAIIIIINFFNINGSNKVPKRPRVETNNSTSKDLTVSPAAPLRPIAKRATPTGLEPAREPASLAPARASIGRGLSALIDTPPSSPRSTTPATPYEEYLEWSSVEPSSTSISNCRHTPIDGAFTPLPPTPTNTPPILGMYGDLCDHGLFGEPIMGHPTDPFGLYD